MYISKMETFSAFRSKNGGIPMKYNLNTDNLSYKWQNVCAQLRNNPFLPDRSDVK